MECQFCNHNSLDTYHRNVEDYEHGIGAPVRFLKCEKCGSVVIDPIPTVAEVSKLYPSEYRAHVKSGFVSQLKSLQARMLFSSFSKILSDKNLRILELGCGGGHFLKELHRRGFKNLVGVDSAEEAAGAIKDNGIRFIQGNIETEKIEGLFDVILLNNVLEHLLDPIAFMERVQKNLAPGGRILLRTPNVESLSHSFFGRYWAGLHSPRHIYLFSNDGLKTLATKTGFGVSELKSLSDPSAWALSVQNIVRDRLHSRRSDATSWYSILSLPFWGLVSTIEQKFRRGSSLYGVFQSASEKEAVLTACIVNFNSAPFIEATLSNLTRLTRSPFQVHVIDNGSIQSDRAELKRLQQKYPQILHLEFRISPFNGAKASFAHGEALDLLLAQVKTDYALVLDADCVPLLPGWDAELLKAFNEKTIMVGAVPPKETIRRATDFPLPFFSFIDMRKYRTLGISCMPRDIAKGEDTCWEWREKSRAAGFEGTVFKSVNTRQEKSGPFGSFTGVEEYYWNGKIIAAHFGRGSTQGEAKFLKGFHLPVVSGYLKRALGRRERTSWIRKCLEIVNP